VEWGHLAQIIVWPVIGAGLGCVLPRPLTPRRSVAAVEGAAVALLTGLLFTLGSHGFDQAMVDPWGAGVVVLCVSLYSVLLTTLVKRKWLARGSGGGIGREARTYSAGTLSTRREPRIPRPPT
jgi:hypothetical protein